MSNDRRVCTLLLRRYTQQRRSATLSQVVAAHMQLDIPLLMHMKCCVGIGNCKIMLLPTTPQSCGNRRDINYEGCILYFVINEQKQILIIESRFIIIQNIPH